MGLVLEPHTTRCCHLFSPHITDMSVSKKRQDESGVRSGKLDGEAVIDDGNHTKLGRIQHCLNAEKC